MSVDVKPFLPENLNECLKLKKRYGRNIEIIAGATDYMVSLKLGQKPKSMVMDLTGVEELRKIIVEDRGIFIGSCVTFNEIAENEVVHSRFAVLHSAVQLIGSNQIRNRATIGGNVASGSPAADSVPPLWVLRAGVILSSTSGTRRVSIRRFYTGYRKNVMRDDEIITGFKLPFLSKNYKQSFYKVGARKAQAISKLSIAAVARLNKTNKKIDDIRIAGGSLAPTVVGFEKTCKYLKGKKPGEKVILKAKQIAQQEITPINDVRSTAFYRTTVAGNLIERFLVEIIET